MKNKVKEFREKKKMSQEKLSELSGISRTTISKIENGDAKSLKSETIIAIAESLHEKVENIFLF